MKILRKEIILVLLISLAPVEMDAFVCTSSMVAMSYAGSNPDDNTYCNGAYCANCYDGCGSGTRNSGTCNSGIGSGNSGNGSGNVGNRMNMLSYCRGY